MKNSLIKYLILSILFCFSFIQVQSSCSSDYDHCYSNAEFGLDYDLSWGCADAEDTDLCEFIAYSDFYYAIGVCGRQLRSCVGPQA